MILSENPDPIEGGSSSPAVSGNSFQNTYIGRPFANQAFITVGAKVGKDDKIFGSVTNIQLADAINKITGIKVDRKKVNILDDIKKTGTYNASIELHRELTIEPKFEVISE